MTIKRIPKAVDLNEMPSAKLYLDDLKTILEILTEINSNSSQQQEPAVVKFQVGKTECDTFDDLEQLGGRARDFALYVKRGYDTSTLKFAPYGTSLWISAPKNDFWIQHGKIKNIFESNAIWWRNALRKFGDEHLGFSFAFPFIWMIIVAVLQYFSSKQFRWVYEYIWTAGLVVWILVSLVGYLWSGSVAVLSYSHTRGWRKWLHEHGTQILLVVLGVILKSLADLTVRFFQHH